MPIILPKNIMILTDIISNLPTISELFRDMRTLTIKRTVNRMPGLEIRRVRVGICMP